MATYRTEITSTRPQADLFLYMARFSNAAEWDPGVAGATEAEPGAPGLGSTYQLVVRAFGRAVPLSYRIVDFDRPHRVVLSAENSMVRSTDVIEVVPEAGGGSALRAKSAQSVGRASPRYNWASSGRSSSATCAASD